MLKGPIPFLDCKHKYMMKSGAPPDESRSPANHLLIIEFHGFTSRTDF